MTAQRPPRTDQHVITTDEVDEIRDGVSVAGWTAFCSCGWRSRVFTSYEEEAIRAQRKHADWIEKPVQRRNVTVQITLRSGESITAAQIAELVRTAERGAR